MKFNENIAISTAKVLLVPYDAHHVPQYHAWMEDAAIREATASDRLTLDEEYENQISWRTSADKLTFIVCKPLDNATEAVVAGEADRNERMVGDINLFLTAWEEEEEEEGKETAQTKEDPAGQKYCVGEIDIMIASTANRRKGMGRAAVSTFLWFIKNNIGAILTEYAGHGDTLQLKELLVRIQATNEGSMALFKSLGFKQRGDINYFGEVEMVLQDLEVDKVVEEVEEYSELPFDRSKLT